MSIKKIFAAALVCTAFVTVAFGQTAKYPFPQNITYPHGYMPTNANLNSTKAQGWYDTWKTNHIVTTCTHGIMPTADDQTLVKVEGMGWAMIATAYMGDKVNFDGIYKFYNSKLNGNNGNMMDWKVTCNEKQGNGTATDGDLDVAFGLVVASWQWGGAYLDSAKVVIARCKTLIDQNCAAAGGLHVLKAGSGYGGCSSYTDLSYYTPAFFRVFAEVTNDPVWTKLANDTYEHLAKNANSQTGIISGWQDMTGKAIAGPSGNAGDDSTYNFDACRVPWRFALDYLWNGNEQAKAWCEKITTWANNQGVNNLKSGYTRSGTATTSSNAGMPFIGAWAVGAMANENQTVRNNLQNYVASQSNNAGHWYPQHTGNMYMLALTGNMWKEDLVSSVTTHLLTTAVVGGGIVDRSPNAARYENGASVRLAARPNSGWKFDSWSGAVTGTDTVINVLMNEAKSITATFVLSGNATYFNHDYEDGTAQSWYGRGDASVTNTTQNKYEGTRSIYVTGRTSAWHSVAYNLNSSQFVPGYSYRFSVMAMQNATALDTFKLTLLYTDNNSEPHYDQVALAAAPSGQWVQLANDAFSIPDNVTELILYVETSNSTINFYIDDASGGVSGSSSISDNRVPQPNVKKSSLKVTAKKSAVNVKFKAKNSGTAELRLYGLKGNLVTKASLQTVAGKSYSHTFNAGKLPNGFYIVSVHSNGSIEKSRVIMPK